MINSASLVSLGGVVIWNYNPDGNPNPDPGSEPADPVSKLISAVLLQERGADHYGVIDGLHFRWKLVHSLGAIFYISYEGSQRAQNLINLLDACAEKYEALVAEQRGTLDNINWILQEPPTGFDKLFWDLVLEHADTKAAASVDQTPKANKGGKAKPVKTKREWGYKGSVTKKDIDALDFSDEPAPDSTNAKDATTPMPSTSVPNFSQKVKAGWASFVARVAKPQNKIPSGTKLYNTFANMVTKYTGNLELTAEHMEEPLKEMRLHLASKNVGHDACTVICDSVASRLIGKRTESLKSVKVTLHESFKEAVRRILTPSEPIDILHAIEQSRANKTLYSIAFVGVNGVGKSSSLAKICWLLKNNGIRVLIIACDTFRSGAVEQLKTHANRLDVELFDRGYGKDPATVAKEGLAYAQINGFDVVLIDTAGRMQDNEGLMAALGKLVQVNKPNLVLFVGEALVGNDAIDQLVKFNQQLIKSAQRTIDGIILTKYDTVDDKVGAALSMAYTTGKPIVFVGTGQGYQHLARLNVDDVTNALVG